MDLGGVKHGQRNIVPVYQERQFGAAEDHAFGAGGGQRVDHARDPGAAGGADAVVHQFRINDVMQRILFVRLRGEHGDPVRGQAVVVEASGHGLAHPEQGHLADARCTYPFGRLIDNADEGQADLRQQRRREAVRAVGAQ
jgi:hypothetical protein